MNNAAFAKNASQWFSLAAQLLGWRPAEFWSATPGELAMALADPRGSEADAAPSRELIEYLMERDAHG